MFLELEGVELCLLFLKGEGKVARSRGLKVLDFAVGGVGGGAIAEKLVDAGGLKVLFGMFMKKVPPLMSLSSCAGILLTGLARQRDRRASNRHFRQFIPPSTRRFTTPSAPARKIRRKRLHQNLHPPFHPR